MFLLKMIKIITLKYKMTIFYVFNIKKDRNLKQIQLTIVDNFEIWNSRLLSLEMSTNNSDIIGPHIKIILM